MVKNWHTQFISYELMICYLTDVGTQEYTAFFFLPDSKLKKERKTVKKQTKKAVNPPFLAQWRNGSLRKV